MAKEQEQSYTTEPGIIVFPNFFEAKPVVINGKERGDPMFGCEVLFDHDDIKPAIQAAQKLAQDRFPNKDVKSMKFPFSSGDKKAAKQEEKGRDAEFYKGKTVLKATSKFQPGVVDRQLQNIIDPNAIYSGMFGRVQIMLKTFNFDEDANNLGVTAYLQNVMKTADGERLVGGPSAKQAFASFATTGQTTNEDPTAGGDDLPWE